MMWQLITNAVNPKPGKTLSLEIHPSRLIIAAEGSEDGSIYGTPALEGCYRAISDWDKVRAAAAEGLKRSNDQRANHGLARRYEPCPTLTVQKPK